jgi:hypothetical protein
MPSEREQDGVSFPRLLGANAPTAPARPLKKSAVRVGRLAGVFLGKARTSRRLSCFVGF